MTGDWADEQKDKQNDGQNGRQLLTNIPTPSVEGYHFTVYEISHVIETSLFCPTALFYDFTNICSRKHCVHQSPKFININKHNFIYQAGK